MSMTSSSSNPNFIVAAAQDMRADFQKYFLDAGVGPGQKMAQEHNVHMFDLARNEYNKRFQTATADARKAGLHPLFALGGGVGSSPSSGGSPGVGPRPRPASQSNYRMGGMSASAERRANETHAMDMKIAEQRIKANDIELMMANSQAAVLQRELQNSPVMAAAFSADAVEAERQKVVQDEWNRNMRIRVPPGGIDVHGPAGGRHKVPAGITPQSVVEELIGEAAEGHGVATAMRMYLTETDANIIKAKIKRQVRAAIRQRLANKRRNQPPGYKRLYNRWKKWRNQ
jgi:hypothetical protein